jgi:serine/threonine protein phosphatase PrpC
MRIPSLGLKERSGRSLASREPAGQIGGTSTEAGDVFVLASSGLREALGDGLLTSTLLAHRPDARALAQALLDEASANGGRDTLTVVVVTTSEDGELSPMGAWALR